MAAGREQTTWFERHGSTPITDIPAHWPEDYRAVVQRRIDAIEQDKTIALLERPEFKRRWNSPRWPDLEQAALRDALLARGGAYAEVLARGRAVRVAVNQVMGREDTALQDGAEVAFFPPVTGG